MLIVAHLSAAELHCPVRIEESRLRTLLDRHGLRLGDVFTSSRSSDLQSEIDKIALAYRTDKPAACDSAWKNFGPGAPYGGFLERR